MPSGTVTVVFERETYGFITSETHDQSLVFSVDDVEDLPQEGEYIEFTIEDRGDDLRPRAIELRRSQ